MRLPAATPVFAVALAILAMPACKPDETPEPQAPAAEAKPAAKPKQAKAARTAPEPAPEDHREALRFDMTQEGQAQTAERFDAWMEEQGVRVAKGAPADAPAPGAGEADGKDAAAASRE